MSLYIDKETRADVIVREIEDDAQIAIWLLSRALVEMPASMYTTPPHVGEPGQFVVVSAKDGEWSYEVLDADALAERYEQKPDPAEAG